MKIYYGKQEGKKLKSKIHEIVEKEESLVPELADFRNMKVSKIRKVLKTWHRDTQITSKLNKHGAAKLRNIATRHMWEEMLYHDESMDFGDEEEKRETVPDKKEKKEKKTAAPKKAGATTQHVAGGTTVVINTGKSSDKECECAPFGKDEPEPNDPMKKLLYKLAPNLFKTAISKAFLLDLCNLDRMRQEGRQCPIDCRPAAFDPNKCCFNPCPTYGAVGGLGGPATASALGLPTGAPSALSGCSSVPDRGRGDP